MIGHHGSIPFNNDNTVITNCNDGVLVTVRYDIAVDVIYRAVE
ncbi:hypothetical protein DSUL_100047 [Desulfovibrionales bacterium]